LYRFRINWLALFCIVDGWLRGRFRWSVGGRPTNCVGGGLGDSIVVALCEKYLSSEPPKLPNTLGSLATNSYSEKHTEDNCAGSTRGGLSRVSLLFISPTLYLAWAWLGASPLSRVISLSPPIVPPPHKT
jgi:hypothetical protein